MSQQLAGTLKAIADHFDMSVTWLKRYAKEDTLLGFDEGNEQGISYGNEGRILYALTRVLKPERILEIGTYQGGSAAHLAAACKENGSGHVTTVDIAPNGGAGIPNDLREYITVQWMDANFYIPQVQEPFDFIFDDGNHSEFQVHVIYQNLRRILKVGGYILSHDVTTGMAQYIREGMRKGGVNLNQVKIYVTDPSPCGLSMYKFTGENYEPL